MLLKSIGTVSDALRAIATDGRLTEETINSMNLALKGMSEAQIAATVSASGLGAAEIATALSASGLEASQVAATLATLGFSQQATVAALMSLGMSEAEATAAVAGLEFAAAQTTATVATGAFTKAIAAAAKGLWAFLTTNPVGWAILAAGAIFGLVKVVDLLTESFDEAVEKANKSQQAYEETEQKIQSLNSELETTQKRIDELQAKGSLTLVEEEELGKLRTTNELLEQQLEIEKGIANYRLANARRDAENALTKKDFTLFDDNSGGKNNFWMFLSKMGIAQSGGSYKTVDIIDYTIGAQERLNSLLEKQNEIRKQASEETDPKKLQQYNQQIENYENQIADLKDEVSTYLEQIQDYRKTLVDTNGVAIEGFEDVVARIDNANLFVLDSMNTISQATKTKQADIDSFLSKPTLSKDIDAVKEKARELNGITFDQIKDEFPSLASAIERFANQAEVTVDDVVNSINSSVGTVNIDAIKGQLKEAILAGSPGYSTPINEWFRGISDDDIKILYGIYKSNDTSAWSFSDWTTALSNAKAEAEEASEEFSNLPKGFEAVKSSVESVANAHKELNTVLANGDSLTESAYQALVTLAGGEEALAGSVDVANGYLITNADNLNDLVDAATEAAKADLKLAESQQMLKHHELVKTLKSVCDGLEDYDEGTMAVVSSLLEQIDATELQIAQYKLLEQQILGVTNAFDKMANAKAIDTARDYTDDLAESISGLISSFENHEFGTEYFKTAFESLIPEDIYSQFTEAGDQLDAGWDYLNTKLARYFSFENGSASIDFGNVKTFVQDALNTAFGDSTVFTGTLEKFDLNPQITSVQELADAMGVTTTVAFSMANAISKYTTDNDDFLSKLSMDGATLETQMLACDQQMAQLLEKQTQLGKSGQVGTEEWEALQADIAACNQQMSDLQQKARENISANIKVESDIVEKQQEVDDLKAQLDGLDEHSAYYQAVLENYEQAQQELDTLIQKKYNLEEPTSITIEVALEQVQSEIDQTKTELQKIADYDGESYHLKAECSADSEQFDLLVEKLATLEQEQTEIMVYAGIDDEDAMNGLETIEEFKINDKKFSVQANTSAALNALQNVINTLARIQSKTVTVTTITREQKSSKAYGNANYRGTAHEHGVWGTKTAEKNALLGELGEEIVVDPRTGVWQTVGENGAVLMNLPEGAIVFNHRQTEQLLKNRRIDSRGKAYAWGNAHFSGFGDNGGYTFGTPTSNPKTESIRTSTPTTPTTTVPVTIQPTVDNKTLEEQLEETLEKMQDTIDDVIGNYEHEIFLKEKKNAPVEEIVAIYKSMQQYVHEQANAFRELGLDENSDYIQNLQKQWWDYQENIVEAMTDAYNEVTKQHENAITLNQNWLDNAIKANDYEGVVKYTSNIIEHYKQMQQNIHEQAEYYRSLGYSDTSDEISELSDLWWDYQENIENAMADAFQQIVDNAHDALDDIQGFYDTLKGAAKEYAESGYITVDTLQEICKYGVQYLAFLQDENGQFVINEQSIQNLIAARTRQMAVETALNYVQQIRTALMNNDAVALNNLLYATDAATSSTWELVYAQLELLNLNSDQYNAALQRINALRSLSEVAVHSIGAVDGSLKQTLQDTQSALEDILKYVEAMIKQEVQNQIDALKQQVSDMKEIVNLQKQSLDLERKKDSYTKSIKDKTKELADLQKQLALQELDTSRDSQARQLELREKIAKLSDDIADEQADHAYDATSDMLDDMADAYEKEKDKEIKVLEDSISSEEKLYQLAIQRINTQWDSLYEDLIAWNTQYGTVINDDLTAAWNNASRAVQEYGSYLEAVQRVQAEINAMDTAAYNVVGNTDGLTKQDHETKTANTEAAKREVRDIVNEARMYSASWSPTNSQESKDWLHQQVADRFKELEKYGIYASFNAASGVWTITRDDLDPKNVGKTIYAAYHKGGVVGEPTLKQDEEFAKLKKGEIVVTKEQQEPIFRLLDFSETMLSKYGQLFNAASGSDMMASRMEDQIKRDGKQAQSIVENSNNSFNIEVPVQIHTVQKLDATEIRELTDKISKNTMGRINESYVRRGKRGFRP